MTSERPLFRRFAKLGTLFVVNVAVLGFLVLGFGREYLRNREIEHSIDMLEAEQAELEGRRLESLSVIESLSSEYYLEQEGRKKQGLAKPGEELIVVNTARAASVDDDVQTAPASMYPNVLRWYLYFFDHAAFEDLRGDL